ncbi:MAG: heme-binding protein [Gallionella sp.]|nr:heme-binding protein [Gallionella sp.]
MWWIILGVVAFGAAAWGPVMSNVEQPKYAVVESLGSIEIRDYPPMIVAEAEVQGERKAAINQGFRMIADYIFGNNASVRKVAMTAPVTQQASEQIAMTAPVTQEAEGAGWKIRFVMPGSYTMESLPKPNNDAVKLRAIEGKRFAVIRFSGMSSGDNLEVHESKLASFIKEKQLQPLSVATYAFYNPPWTLPFLRRNEVMVEVGK